MGYIVGITLLVITTIASLFITWRSENSEKETYSLKEFKREVIQRDILLLMWLANTAYWALAAMYGWIE